MTRKDMIRAFREAHMTERKGQKIMKATRVEFLAYGYARGRHYRHIEQSTRPYEQKGSIGDQWYNFAQTVKALIPEQDLKDAGFSKDSFTKWLSVMPADMGDRFEKIEAAKNAAKARKLENNKKYEKYAKA